MNGGKEATAKWTGYHDAKSKIRSFGLSDTQNLIARVKEADSDLKEIFTSVLSHMNSVPLKNFLNICLYTRS